LSGMTGLVEVIESGSTTPGTLMSEASDELLKAYAWADIIIAKGQGNLETCDTMDKPVYFLLKMKCPMLAGGLGVNTGELVLYKANSK
ncbi:MAG: ARMT1-like domain-containing protein, partial [Candidatus Margulisiibacteriota bacterium]